MKAFVLLQLGGDFLVAINASKCRRLGRDFVTFNAVRTSPEVLMRSRKWSWRYLGTGRGEKKESEAQNKGAAEQSGSFSRPIAVSAHETIWRRTAAGGISH
jgi:hypothetical protein